MDFISIHDFLRAVIREHPKNIVAMTMEFAECSAAMTARHYIPRSKVAIAAVFNRDAETLRIPFKEILLRGGEIRRTRIP